MNSFMLFMGFKTIFFLFFIIIMGTIAIRFFNYIIIELRNNSLPVNSESSKVIGKRTHISRYGANNNVQNITSYYITFQNDYGERREFRVKDRAFGMLVEGDVGILDYQGTRYLGFEILNL